MLKPESEKVGRIVDALMCVKVEGNSDLFGKDSDLIVSLERRLNEARKEQLEIRKSHILVAFRAAVTEFKVAYEKQPTVILMNCMDIEYLCDEYNQEKDTLKVDRERVYRYIDDDKRLIDGIKVKQGCDTLRGQLRIHAFE